MVKKLKAAWWRLPSWLRAAINTSWATFLAAVTVPVLGWLADLQGWIEGTGDLPSAELLGRVVAAAGVSAIAGVITAWFRHRRPPETAYPTTVDAGGTNSKGN